MADGFDFVIKTANGRIGVPQQLVTEREILAESFLQLSHFNIGIVELRDQPDGRESVDRQSPRRYQFRAAEEITLEVVESQRLAKLSLFARAGGNSQPGS